MEKKKDIHVTVAEKLIEQLQQGTAPWQKSWDGGQTLPVDASTGDRYRGGNALLLAAQERNDPRWMTFQQAKGLDAQIRKGEHGTPIVYWKFEEEQTVRDKNGKPILDTEGKPCKEFVSLERPRSFIGYMFNAEQIDGLPSLERQKEREWKPVERAEALLQASGAKLEYRSQGRAFYRSSTDTIILPEKTQFSEEKDYYATALHELGHWTGHENRLNRNVTSPSGSAEYAREELRAELVSMMLGDTLGIGHSTENHTAYVNSWIKMLQDDPGELFRAAADAEKILDYLMELELKQEQRQVQEEHQIVDAAEAVHENISENSKRSPAPSLHVQPVQTSELRYLDVPYKEKDEVKDLGAKWDRQERAWYIPQGLEENTFEKWLPALTARAVPTKSTLVSQIAPEGTPAAAQKKAIPIQDSRREYLIVPYEAKAEAKAAGAQWDSVGKSWYVGPQCTDAGREKLAKWLPERVQREQAPTLPPREEFAEALRELGFKVDGDHPVMDGKPHRITTEDDKTGAHSGFYVGHLDGRPAGYAKNNQTDEEIRWKSTGMRLSPQEEKVLHSECVKKIQERSDALKRLHEETAQRITEQMKHMQQATTPTPYMTAKCIRVHPWAFVRNDGKITCLPAQDADGKIRTMQYIMEDGTKRFAKNSSKNGCFHPLGGMNAVQKAPAFVICEGYATASSVAEALGFATIAAFDAGNVVSVARSLHVKYPGRPIVIAGDDDCELAMRTGRNPGREKATQAAKEVGGQVVFPIFAPDERGQKAYTDFNDLAAKSKLGCAAVVRQVGPMVRKAIELKHQEQEQQREQSLPMGITLC